MNKSCKRLHAVISKSGEEYRIKLILIPAACWSIAEIPLFGAVLSFIDKRILYQMRKTVKTIYTMVSTTIIS
ncbi:hypothetical protein ACFL0O_04300 [Thermodesulfobacteriota bacterium]